jgi:hypothetical protein
MKSNFAVRRNGETVSYHRTSRAAWSRVDARRRHDTGVWSVVYLHPGGGETPDVESIHWGISEPGTDTRMDAWRAAQKVEGRNPHELPADDLQGRETWYQVS